MSKQVGGVVSVIPDLPTAAGRMAEFGRGAVLNVGFRDPRPDTAGSPAPELDPAVSYPGLLHQGTKIASSINALTLIDVAIPKDMVDADFLINDTVKDHNVIYPADPLSQAWFHHPKVSLAMGQGLTNAINVADGYKNPPNWGPGTYSDAANPAPDSAKVYQPDHLLDRNFVTHEQLADDQGFTLSWFTYNSGNHIQDLATNLIKTFNSSGGPGQPAQGTFSLINLAVAIAALSLTIGAEKYATQLLSEFIAVGWGVDS